MFGKNPVQKQDTSSGENLRIVRGSPWHTIQGEGPFAGMPAVFVRLHGCNLRCWFCDTDFSNPNDPLIDKSELVRKVMAYDVPLCVLTGGEPLRQDIRPLVRDLISLGVLVQIETAGTLWLDGLETLTPYIIVSPKTSRIHELANFHAMAFKYVVNANMEFTPNGFPKDATQPGARPCELASPLNPRTRVYYSPMDEYDDELNAQNREIAGWLAMKHNRRVTLQMHKYLGLD